MEHRPRKLLKGKQGRCTAPGGGCLGMGCSIPLLVLGWLALIFTIEDPDIRPLQPFLTAVGLMLFLFGCYFMIRGIRNFIHTVRFRSRKKQYPDQPWLYDYPWNPEGYAASPMSTVIHYGNLFIMFSVFALPWNIFAFHPEMPLLFMIIVGVPVLAFDAGALLCGYKAVRTWVHWYKYGAPYIWFDHFPYQPGGEMTVELGATKKTGPYPEIELTLRCIERVPSQGGSNSGPSLFEIYADTHTVKDEEGLMLDQEAPIPVTFSLPDDAHTTCLSQPNAWYWELTAKARAPSGHIDFKAEFLIPIYEKQAANTQTSP